MLWQHSPAACVPTTFLLLRSFHECFTKSIETRYVFSISLPSKRQFSTRKLLGTCGPFFQRSRKIFAHGKPGKIPNPKLTELFYSHFRNMKRDSLHTRSFRRIRLSTVFRYRLTFRARQFSGCFKKRGPGHNYSVLCVCLRWLKTVSSAFQDLDFNVSL